VRGTELSAERGFLRETGNLFFHVSLLALLVAVGLGSAFGFKGTVIVREGSGFANNVTQYDTFAPGRLFDPSQLVPFSFTVEDFSAMYQVGGMQAGAPRDFTAAMTVRTTPGSDPQSVVVKVNEPLRVAGISVYLVGHGYSPEFTVRNAAGDVVWQDAAVFLPLDGGFTSQGVVKAPDTVPQIGIDGVFTPTAAADGSQVSTFPAPTDPRVFITAWQGDLGLDSGVPQSVYRLDTAKLAKVGTAELAPGQTWTLPDGAGSVAFTGYREWASFSITRDAGKGWALGAGMASITGLMLSLVIPRRRVWLRATESGGRTLCEVAGLSKTEAPGLLEDVQRLVVLVTAGESDLREEPA
jgi:cytochrome c biogenesis protein